MKRLDNKINIKPLRGIRKNVQSKKIKYSNQKNFAEDFLLDLLDKDTQINP